MGDMDEQAVAWLRGAISERKTLAEAAMAGEDDDGVWQAGTEDNAFHWAREVRGKDIHIYDEGGHDEAQAAHIAFNDPRQIIADCEADLAILDEHRLVVAAVRGSYAGSTPLASWEVAHDHPSPEDLARLAPGILEPHCRRCQCPFPCWDILNLRTAYRHHDGYAKHWSDA